MANIMRVKLRWSGFIGAPGYSIFHLRDFNTDVPTVADATAAVNRINTFAGAFKGFCPSVVSLQVMSDVEVIEDTTGEMVNILNGGNPAAVTGGAAATNTYAAAVGANITWRTGGIRNGRRVRGRTFIVPLTGSAFDTNGTLAASTITALTSAATGLTDATGSPDLGVYARPSATGATDGSWHAVTGFSIPDMSTVLRSRRD